jgi:hypothetical protein
MVCSRTTLARPCVEILTVGALLYCIVLMEETALAELRNE